MGLISAIRPTELDRKISEPKKIDRPSDRPVTADRPVGRTFPRKVIATPGRDPVPCELCHGPLFWTDAFGAVRCCDCSPSPARSLVHGPLWGIVGPPGGPWWWETLGGRPDDRIAFGGLVGPSGDGNDLVGGNSGPGGRQLVEHVHHGHELITVVGSGTVAGSRDNWTKCLVFCWPEPKGEKMVAK